MADIIDAADEAAELFKREALSRRQPEGPVATGECLNCEAPLPHPKRWCDAHCRNDWEKRGAKQGS